MIDSNETLVYKNGKDAGYAEGFEDGLNMNYTPQTLDELIEKTGIEKRGFYMKFKKGKNT